MKTTLYLVAAILVMAYALMYVPIETFLLIIGLLFTGMILQMIELPFFDFNDEEIPPTKQE